VASLSAVGGVLAQRNARIFYAGSVTCWTGSWMQRVATDWLAWELTHSVLWVSVIAFCNLAPSVVISPLAGAMADRVDRVRLTVASQFVAAGQAAILVILILTGTIRVELIAALSCANGIAETFAQPARQCLIPGLVPRAYLPGAVALNSLTYNVARFIGPALSGPMIAAWGVVPPIICNGLAFLFASLTMYLLRLDPSVRLGHRSSHSVFHDALEGIRYVARRIDAVLHDAPGDQGLDIDVIESPESFLGERRRRTQLAGAERRERPACGFDDFRDPLKSSLERHRIGEAHALDCKTRESCNAAGILADARNETVAAVRHFNSLDHGSSWD